MRNLCLTVIGLLMLSSCSTNELSLNKYDEKEIFKTINTTIDTKETLVITKKIAESSSNLLALFSNEAKAEPSKELKIVCESLDSGQINLTVFANGKKVFVEKIID